MEDIDYQLLYNGKIKIYKNGDIFRLSKKGIYEEVCKTKINGKYEVITFKDEEKRKTVYVHQLMAEAFVPNPLNKEKVTFKNGDSSDCSPNNLEWTDRSAISKATVSKKPINAVVPCKVCGKNTSKKDGICSACLKKEAAMSNLGVRDIEKEMLFNQFSSIPSEPLTEKQRVIHSLILRGYTNTQIAKEIGCSRQNVLRKIEEIKKKVSVLDAFDNLEKPMIELEIKKINEKIDLIEIQIKNLYDTKRILEGLLNKKRE